MSLCFSNAVEATAINMRIRNMRDELICLLHRWFDNAVSVVIDDLRSIQSINQSVVDLYSA